jgi:hypothetical protein
MAPNKDTLRDLVTIRPKDQPQCLLVTSRTATGNQQLLRNCTLLHKYPADSDIGKALNAATPKGSTKPSPVLVFNVPPDNRDLTPFCKIGDDDPALHMVFQGQIEHTKAPTLFDSGAERCFIHHALVRKCHLPMHRSEFKAVSTADGKPSAILGAVTFNLRLANTSYQVTANVLPSILDGVQLIIGQDFLSKHEGGLLYGNPPRCVLNHPIEKSQVTLFPKGTYWEPQPEEANHTSTGTTSPSTPGKTTPRTQSDLGMSVAMAVRCLKKAPDKAFVAFIQPVPIDPPPEPPKTHTPTPPTLNLPPDIPGDIKAELEALIKEFPHIFSEKPRREGAKVDTIEHAIDTIPGAKPTFRRNHRFSPLEMAELKKQVQEFLDLGLITPSNSPYGAPVLFVPKPCGGLRFCLDYRALNQITQKTRYQLPRIDDLLDAANGATHFSTLDLACGYYQLRISPSDQAKTAFPTPLGHFEWKVLPMGLTNAPSSFMRTMQKVFEKYIGDFVLVYLDDILVLSKDAKSHITNLRQVFQTLSDHNFTVKLSKCKFLQEQVKYLGHILSKDGIKPDPAKIQSLQDWELPTDATGMLQFLGLANYFRKFIPDFSRLSASLYHLTKKGVLFEPGEEALLCFKAIKTLLMEPPLLVYPNPDLPYELISDASITGCGAVLTQLGKPIAYFSSRFSSAERNYTTGEQEMLGIIKALKEWRCYLEGHTDITLVTDHNPLTFFSVQPTLSRRQARWSEFLGRFHYKVKYRPGASNPADPLSRLPDPLDKSRTLPVTLALLAATVSELNSDILPRIKAATAADPDLGTSNKHTRKYTQADGYWTFKGRIVVPDSMQREIIENHHSSISAGHFGENRTLTAINRHFWWPRMHEAIATFVAECPSCQQNKASRKRPYGLLQPLQSPDTRWHTLTMDFITDLPTTSTGNDTIMVIVDKLTKYVILIPTTKTCTSEDACRLFMQHVYPFNGIPKVLISDRDTRFTANFWKAFCKRLQMDHRYSTAFHPQTDGQTERTNTVIEEVLRHFLDGKHKTWEDLLPLVAFAINNAKSATTQETPFYLNNGRRPLTPFTLGIPQENIPALEAVFQDMDQALNGVKALITSAQDRQKHYADKKRAPHQFQTGDKVWLSTKNIKFQKGKKKLHPKFIGPFTIEAMIGSDPTTANAAKLTLPSSYKIHPVFHVSLLKPYKEGSSTETRLNPLPDIVDGIPYYTVEKVLAHRWKKTKGRKGRGTLEFLIKWLGYDTTHNSWEPKKNLEGSECLDGYDYSS